VNLLVHNEFGTHVAFFPGPVRGEFHFATTEDIPSVGSWPARGAAVAEMVVLDREGLLRPVLEAVPEQPAIPADPEEIADLCGRFANWLVLALHVTARGERLRAQDALAHAARHLLWMARLAEDSTRHWLTPSRAAEGELPAHTVAALTEGTPGALWREARVHWRTLLARSGAPEPVALFADIDALVETAGTRAPR
jgi:lincosamide nucleotidyltransferase